LRKNMGILRIFALLMWTVLIGSAPSKGAQALSEQRTANNKILQATIRPDGSYELEFSSTGWRLGGKLPENPASIKRTDGTDSIGGYEALSATYRAGARTEEIRVYKNSPMVLFEDTWNTAGPNEAPFPAFEQLPSGLMKFSYQEAVFGIYEFGALGPEGPWSLFDKQGDVLLLSPADHFLVSRMEESAQGGAVSRIVDSIQALPAGFSHRTLVVCGRGMNGTFAMWGAALMALGGKQRPANDANVVLAKLGYWTDRGARYYYKFEPQLGYTGTLLALKAQFEKLGVPFGYMQLDSWWYPKGNNDRWDSVGSILADGEDLYQADKELFPTGLVAFQQSLGLPMMTHARWISTASPYREKYKMSANVIVDPAYWNSTAEYLAQADVVTYEQDWLNQNARPELNLEDPQNFLGDMSRAMLSKGISIQYCMPLPAHYMASTQYANVHTIRPSHDRFDRDKWDSFLYDSRLASAVGLWPWTDVFFSAELPNLILSTLSAGPVGVGDALGGTNGVNLAAAIRRDGVIVKPDTPVLPIDTMYASDATSHPPEPMVAMAHTSFGDFTERYVFAYARAASEEMVSVPLGNLEFSGPVFAYNWAAHTGEVIPAGGILQLRFVDGWDYQVLAPVNKKGLALLGDIEQIVPVGKQRIAALSDNGSLTATVKFAPGEDLLTISGYASNRPKINALRGRLTRATYEPKTDIFQAQLAPDSSGQAVLRVTAR
jgi:hypothetical protein